MIYLITNCTNAKKIPSSENLLFRNYPSNTLEFIASQWNENIYHGQNNRYIDSKSLYLGVSWKAILEAEKNFTVLDETKLLISSAGYGLIDSNKKITSYGITFAKGHLDSLRNFKHLNNENITSQWWDLINKFDISSLNNSNISVFIGVSYEYLIAMKSTILQLIEKFGKQVFIIVLSKKKLPDSYQNNILRFDTRFNSYEKGTMTTLISRFLRWLSKEIYLKNLSLNHFELQNYINNFLAKYDKFIMPKRINLSDKEIVNFIKTQIYKRNITTKTKGLKDLRTEGYACAQNRYNRLYEKTTKENL